VREKLFWQRFASALLAVFLVSSTASVWAATPNGGGAAPVKAKSKEPIKIGFVTSLSGAGAQDGQRMVNGVNLYLNSIGRKMAGRPVKLMIENDESSPPAGIGRFRKLIDADKVNILSGLLFAHIFYAVADIVEKSQTPMVDCVSGADDITQRKRKNWVIRTSWTSSQPAHPFGEYVAKKLGYKKVVTLVSDYPYGYEVAGGFQQSFEDNGGQVVQKLWAPLGLTDFKNLIKKIRPDADAIFICIVGQSSELIPAQVKAFGPHLPIIGATTSFEEAVLAKVGIDLAGCISTNPYTAALDTPANKKFVAAYRKAYKTDPGWYSECGYTNMMAIHKAVDEVNGNVEDKAALMAALKKLELKDAPRGPIKIDDYGNPTDNIYIRKVEKKNGSYQNTVIFTYPMVSQFWKWKPEDYLKQPSYTKTYPLCKYCSEKAQ
jgi:branched-chain amino acid transport system substrate-binding protein